ncbi:MAG: hypothetical protein CL678_00260 [Bdellovibrionaceae bacterium]|nr:hypothetical protein [Pseudobdellovibrionaceae bacterium]|tara:strand:- start:5806 stop:6126 length:321 start_codon:yes stop_codon:yes gene_type:complete
MKWKWFISGIGCGLITSTLCFGSVPKNVTNDGALYEELVPSRAKKIRRQDIRNLVQKDYDRLANQEDRYRNEDRRRTAAIERRLRAPMRRIQKRSYKLKARKVNRR